MSEAKYRALFTQIKEQMAGSDPVERERLNQHLNTLHQEALAKGIRIEHPGARPEQDRVEEDVEANFDNLPI